MSSYAEMGHSGMDGAKILVFGAVGDKLKKIDPKRMMALIQQDPSFFLNVIANIEADEIIELILGADDITENIEKAIIQSNKLHTIFTEAADYLHEANDTLATGSFVAGEFEQKKAILKTMGKVEKNEGDG